MVLYGNSKRSVSVWSGVIFPLLLITALLTGCRTGKSEKFLTVFAASSLTVAFEELGEVFEERNSGVEVRLNFAGSSTLATQISHGAPVDVFASADEDEIRAVVEEGLANGPGIFAENTLAVIVSGAGRGKVSDFKDLASADARLVLAEDGVPIAKYTDRVLVNAESEYGTGFRRDVVSRVVSREADVRAAANKVALGEADVTFVYRSDLTPDISKRVEVLEIPEEFNVVAHYPMAVLKDTSNPELARAWVDLVFSEEGQDSLERAGFRRVR